MYNFINNSTYIVHIYLHSKQLKGFLLTLPEKLELNKYKKGVRQCKERKMGAGID
jgi:hypothetical protein